jgi:Right handed beta helix region
MRSRLGTVTLAATAALALGGSAATHAAPASRPAGRDDTAWLQARLDAGGGVVSLPKLPGGACYATRGLWVSHDDTSIVSNGACITALGPGPARIASQDGDPVAADAVFFVNRSRPLDQAPVRIAIRGLRIVVPREVDMFGIGIFGHEVTVRDVTVTGDPIDAITVGGRANGDGFAGRVSIVKCRLLAGTRNVLSATSVIGLRVTGSTISGASDTHPETPGGKPYGNPAAGIDLEPGGRGSPALDVRFERNTIARNAGPGILVGLSTNLGRLVYGTDIAIVRNRIVGNGTKPTPPQHGGIVFDGGQDRGGGRVLVERNVVRGNRGAGLQGRADVNLVVVARHNDLRGNTGGPVRGLKLRG